MTADLTATTASDPLRHLLQVFDTASIGEGDVAAGANVLAAQCISLANLYPPGACLTTEGGQRLPVGMSFLSVGGLTRPLVREQVLDPIASLQNNLGDHLAAEVAHAAAKLAAVSPSELIRNRPEAPVERSAIGKLRMDIDPRALVAPARDSSPFFQLLVPCRDSGLGELAATPGVFLRADSVAGLEKQLAQAHRRHPYVRATLADGTGAARLESLLLTVMQGTSLPNGTTGPVHIKGHVAASCNAEKLARSIEADAGDAGLLSNLLWLVDGDVPASLSLQEDAGSPPPYPTHINYPQALYSAMAWRLDHRQPTSTTILYPWHPRQREWVALLQKLEPRCPGLTQSARPLFGTLIFGLSLLSRIQSGEKPSWTDIGAFELAKFLVARMVQCRDQIAQKAELARLWGLAIKLIPKLEAGPLSDRQLCRKTSRLNIGDCRQALDLIGRFGLARRGGDGKWELMLPVAQAVERLRQPCIDI